jgi:hypothetical protein
VTNGTPALGPSTLSGALCGRQPLWFTGKEVSVTRSTTAQAIAMLTLLVGLVVVIELAKLTV